jgi:hypothetical protein
MSRTLFLGISVIILLTLIIACSERAIITNENVGSQEPDTIALIAETDQQVLVTDSTKAEPAPLSDTMPNRILSYGKTGCFGNCPAFEFHVFDDGTVQYSGKRAVDLIGYYSGTIGQTEMDNIFSMAAELGIGKLSDNYPINKSEIIADLPSTYTLILLDDGYKQIRHNYGGPDELVAFEKYLERTLFEIPLRLWEKP